MLPQGEIAKRLGITRSSVGVHLTNLSKKGLILGKGYVLAEQSAPYVVGIGAANVANQDRERQGGVVVVRSGHVYQVSSAP